MKMRKGKEPWKERAEKRRKGVETAKGGMKLEKGRGGYCKNDTAEKVKSAKKLRLKTWEEKAERQKEQKTHK